MTSTSSTSDSPSSPSSTAPTASLSSPTTTTTGSAGDHIYKGKYTNRSWGQLPPELVRTIATYYLLDVQVSNYCPLTWDTKELWHPRIVYTTFRDANDLERLMQVTPSWAAALETHLFWSKACAALDPHDVLAHYAVIRPQPVPGGAGGAAAQPQAYRLTPFRHFRQMTARSCFVCRINSPYSSVGLAAAKRTHYTPHLGTIVLCREHRKTMFCGSCLREAPLAECDPQFDIHGNAIRFSGYTQPYGPGHVNMGMGGYNPYASPLNPSSMVCCAENEDEETWPGIDTTCRSCRNEWLWRRISTSFRDREAAGGPRFASELARQLPPSRYPPGRYASADWETRQTVDAFIELGEGSISEVLNVAREKFWLRSQTKMPELMEQAVAATRWASEGMGVDFAPHHPATNDMAYAHLDSTGAVSQETTVGNEVQSCSPVNSTSPSPPSPRSAQRSRSPSPRSVYSSEYEGSEEEEDPELLSLTEDAGGVRELAISDWARTRILDGHWCNPADQWYGFAWPAGGGVRDPGEDTENEPDSDEEIREGGSVRRTVRVPATHPCPWSVSSSSPPLPTSEDTHPLPSTARAQAPPSFGLCEQAHRAYQKQIRSILLPAMNNIVRRFVMECMNGAAGDPAVRAARMDPEEVLAELRTPGVWYDGVDWAAGGLGGRGEGERERRREREREEDSASSASSRSDGSHTTSPVLSTSTLQTTPSPPPAHGDDKEKEKEKTNEGTRPRPPSVVPIPVSPVLESPKLLHSIPYVPMTLAHMAQFSLDAFKVVWREACAPLFHCRCSICERAMINASAAAGNPISVPDQAQTQNPVASVPQQPQQQRPAEVALEEVRVISRESVVAEEEEEEEEELYEEEEEEEESEDDSSISGGGDHNLQPPINTHAITPRKRSSGDLEAENLASGGDVAIPRVGTPPKRARTGGHIAPPQSGRGSTAHPGREASLAPSSTDSSATPRQRKRSSEELELGGSTSPSSTDSNKHGGSIQKRLRVESSPDVKETSTTPRSLTASPPSSVTVVSSSEEEDRSRGFVDVGIGEGALKAGLVNGGELDGLYVFEG